MRTILSVLLAFASVSPFYGNANYSDAVYGDELLFHNSDFESGNLNGWTAAGDAFAVQPTRGDNPAARNREASQHQGDFWVGTYERYDGRTGKPGDTRGDEATGTLTSAEFTVSKPFITFRIGGGNLPGETGVKLLCEGKELDLATGIDSESMVSTSYDVSAFIGRTAQLIIYDQASGGWGHINVDDFRGTDEGVPETSLEFAWAPEIVAEAYEETDYSQSLRPQFHFTSKRNWLNDPNGMVFDGENYHLFFQHNPLGTKWGNMTWGHAISPDMVHWKQLKHALLPYRVDRQSGTIFSGTAVIDHNNSLGKQVGETKTMVAFYTFATKPKFYQAMAYSTDKGMTWNYWNEGRAIVPNQGLDKEERDPKVFWHAESKQWVMLMWVQVNPGRVRFFTSQNLTDWEFASDFMADWAFECMDLVFLPVDGDRDNTKAVIYDASFDYEIGDFDGKTFTSESGPLKQGGGDFYAAQTFNNSPGGRAVQIGWMRGGPDAAEMHGLPFNQQMSFPCELSLRSTPAGVRLFCEPIREIDSLVQSRHTRTSELLGPDSDVLRGIEGLDLVDLEIELEPREAKQIVLQLPGIKLTYDVDSQRLLHSGVDDAGNRVEVTSLDNLAAREGSIALRVLVDRLSIEVFAFDGERFAAHYYTPATAQEKPSLRAVGGAAHIKSLRIHELKSAW